jgi:hypothetical protein
MRPRRLRSPTDSLEPEINIYIYIYIYSVNCNDYTFVAFHRPAGNSALCEVVLEERVQHESCHVRKLIHRTAVIS